MLDLLFVMVLLFLKVVKCLVLKILINGIKNICIGLLIEYFVLFCYFVLLFWIYWNWFVIKMMFEKWYMEWLRF